MKRLTTMDESSVTLIPVDGTVPDRELNEDKKPDSQNIYKLIREFSIACDQKNITNIKRLRTNNIILRNNQPLNGLANKVFSSAKSGNRFKRSVINSLLSDCYNEFVDDRNQLLFLYAANIEIDELKSLLDNFSAEDINQLRYTESALIFMLKYGDLENENFVECGKTLIDRGIDINKYDATGKTAIDHVASYHALYQDETIIEKKLTDLAQLFLEKGISENDNKVTLTFLENVMKVDLKNYQFQSLDDQEMLFYYITRNKINEFLNMQNFEKIDVNCNNGDSTLLQFATYKSDNMLPVVQFLLKNKANPNTVTKWNKTTPLEIAALRNHQNIFETLLKCKDTKFDQNQYNNFVRRRLNPIKSKLFELLLESDKINPNFIYEKTGNTPLHYAIIFSHKKAVQKLLKRGSSLVIKNAFGKKPLDIIDPTDLELYFDSCLALDNYTPYFTDVHYKMKFRFNCLIDNQKFQEMNVVAKIGKAKSLKHLLSHPFIHTYISLKWFKTKYYFNIVLAFQIVFFLILGCLFYDPPNSSKIKLIFAIILTIINIIIKGVIFLNFTLKQGSLSFPSIKLVKLHSAMEALLIITTIGSFFQNQFRAFLFIEMAISVLLTAGYHPQLSKWSVMLQRVFKTFAILLIFFSLLVIGFSAGFRVLFQDVQGEKFLGNFTTGLFKTYLMTTGEFEASNVNFNSEFGNYLLFFIFAMSMSLVIVNFWTGVAVTDIERIEKESEINAFKNVIIFMKFIDTVYCTKILNAVRKYLRKPLVFLYLDSKNKIAYDPEKCDVNFFVNKSEQFDGKELPKRIDCDCFNKIRLHYYKLQEVPSEVKIMAKLEELSKALNELKVSMRQTDGGKGEGTWKKSARKKPSKKILS